MRAPWIVCLAVLLLLVGCGGSGEDEERTASAETEAEATAADPPPATDLEEAGGERFAMPGDWLTSAEDSIWVSDAGSVTRIDDQTGKVLSVARVEENPCLQSAHGFGAVWTATCGRGGLTRIDARTGDVTGHISLDGMPSLVAANGSIGVGEGGVWLVVDGRGCEDCSLVRIDPDSLEIDAEISVQAGSAGVDTGGGAVWVTNPIADILQRVDPDSEEVQDIETGEAPRYLAVGEGAVWTLDEFGGTVTKVDPATGDVVATIAIPDLAGEGGVAIGGGSVWIRSEDTPLARIDPGTDAVVERYGPKLGPGSVAVSGDAVWLSAYDRDQLWRLPISG